MLYYIGLTRAFVWTQNQFTGQPRQRYSRLQHVWRSLGRGLGQVWSKKTWRKSALQFSRFFLWINKYIMHSSRQSDKIIYQVQAARPDKAWLTVETCDVKGRNHGQAGEGGKSSKKERLMEKQIARRWCSGLVFWKDLAVVSVLYLVWCNDFWIFLALKPTQDTTSTNPRESHRNGIPSSDQTRKI